MTIIIDNSKELKFGNWSVGKHQTTIVSDQEVYSSHKHVNHGGINDVEYFGGSLVCESVLNEDNARLIAKAPEMFALLNQLVNVGDDDDLGCIIQDAHKIIRDIDPNSLSARSLASLEYGLRRMQDESDNNRTS